ncbi:histidinol dehydrogenase [Aminithiophilus ramosus]|uniref:Histidinol dehydrogenase n=2 Tax=Synergistales TaxID=649776 RepID=A0A9Q7ALW9_9BACT|nr:histidinol dehydrogenase [Aminithiophilus ramosus]QTX31828.1 histidinol dehydrogenase [Aminithiophilus ramosus]QVL35652.1 histidinol dehydrogenase [Synergistota bacterium]
MRVMKEARPLETEEARELYGTVAKIVDDVRVRGDEALLEYGRRFDGSTRTALRVTAEEVGRARSEVDADLLQALEKAAENIRSFALRQRETLTDLPERENGPGVFLGQRVLPVDSCCCYVPGGSYPLVSTALMLAIPAAVAGVPRRCAASPVMKGTDRIHPAVLCALDLAGVTEIYAVGGAQAVAAFAWGTESISPVNLIVGPGNRYVTEAKRQCYGRVGIDFIAGPSEVLILADDRADPTRLAADLLAQAEHDVNARSVLVTTSERLGKEVEEEVERQLAGLSTSAVARLSWENNGEILLVDSPEEACRIANERAPEHLELDLAEAEAWVAGLRNYGSLFIGEWAAEVFGDYLSGTNHTLPTMGAARYTGGLWVGTFLRVTTFQRMTAEGASRLAPLASRIAREEGLMGHAAAAEARKLLR